MTQASVRAGVPAPPGTPKPTVHVAGLTEPLAVKAAT
jgi:hypothetical protein